MTKRRKVLAGVGVLVVVATLGLFLIPKPSSAVPAELWYSDATREFRSKPDAGDLPDLRMCTITSNGAAGLSLPSALVYRESKWTLLRRSLRLGGGIGDAVGYRADGAPVEADGRCWQRYVYAESWNEAEFR